MKNAKYNEVVMKGSHNSYDRNETVVDQITWNDEVNYNCGCGAIELDVAQGNGGNDFSVGHSGNFEHDVKQLRDYFKEISDWSESNPNHDVITIYIDLKKVTTDNFYIILDRYIDQYFRPKFYAPWFFLRKGFNLYEGSKHSDWPKLDELKETFIFCLTGDNVAKEKYSRSEPTMRYCFADIDISGDEIPIDEYRIFYNYHIYHKNRDTWMATFKKLKKEHPQAILRAYIANSSANWTDCYISGCNIIATDKISNYEWAKVGESRFQIIND